MAKTIGVAAFRNACPQLIAQLGRDREPITITKHGRPVAVLSPVPGDDDAGDRIVGAMRGSVSRYDDPVAPAADVSGTESAR